MTLLESVQSVRQNRENRFFTGLMQYAMQDQSKIDVSGDKPKYIKSTNPLPDKTDLWNQYVQMKGGRLAPQDLAAFEQYYNSIATTIKSNELGELSKLSNLGYTDKEIRNVVKDNPDLYNNLLDMVNDLTKASSAPGMSQEERQSAIQASAIAQSYLPEDKQSLLEKAGEFAAERPIIAGGGSYIALRTAERLLSGKSKGIAKRIGLEDVSKKRTPKSKAKARLSNIKKLTPKPGTALIASAVAPSVGEVVAGETGRKLGQYAGAGLTTAAGLRGLATTLTKAPVYGGKASLIARGLGYGGLGLLGLYDLYNTATEE